MALVCALAVDDKVREALNLVDRPISKITLTTEVPPGVRDFIDRQYTHRDTLMDIDPGLMVSIIDAVRYKWVQLLHYGVVFWLVDRLACLLTCFMQWCVSRLRACLLCVCFFSLQSDLRVSVSLRASFHSYAILR